MQVAVLFHGTLVCVDHTTFRVFGTVNQHASINLLRSPPVLVRRAPEQLEV